MSKLNNIAAANQAAANQAASPVASPCLTFEKPLAETVGVLIERIQALETRIHNDEKFILELRSELIDLIDASREPSTPPSNPNNNQPPTKGII